MNKSDFISDAVALDLGKSGVKVAETLEVQIGDEWWRLINSAEPLTTKSFVRRMENDISVEEGVMDLSSLTSSFSSAGSGSTIDKGGNVRSLFIQIKQGEGEADLPCVAVIFRRFNSTALDGRIYNLDGSLYKSVSGSASEYTWASRSAVWDYVNQRVVMFDRSPDSLSYNRVYYFGLTDASITLNSYISSYPTFSSDFKSFPECPEKIYRLYRKTGALTIKAVIPTAGQTANSVATALVSTAGEVAITAGANYRGSEAYLFYSRTHESVGVAWVDTTTGKLYYAVESDSWATAYELSATFSSDGSTLSHFGNMTIGGRHSGEYYVAGRKKYTTGNMGKPVGFTFPSNLAVLGVAESTTGHIRLFGYVGSVLYVYLVSLSDMTIVASGSLDTGTAVDADIQPVKLYETETRELYNLVLCRAKSGAAISVIQSYVVNIEKSTNNVLWIWGAGSTGWRDSTAWAYYMATSYGSYHALRKYKNELMFFTTFARSSGTPRIGVTYRFIPAESVIVCNSAQDVQTLIRSTTVIISPEISAYSAIIANGLAHRQAQHTIAWGETANTIFFGSYNYEGMCTVHMDKITRAYVNTYSVKDITETPHKDALGTTWDAEFEGYKYNEADGTGESVRFYRHVAKKIEVRSPTLGLIAEYPFFSSASSVELSGYPNVIDAGIKDVAHLILSLPTSSMIEFLTLDMNQIAIYAPSYTLSHLAFRVFVAEKQDAVLFVSNCIGGEIAYTKFKCNERNYSNAVAFNSADFTDTYALDMGNALIGGEHSAVFAGSWLLSRDYVNRVRLVETGTGLTDYVGGTPPENTGAVIYVYEQMNYIPYPFAREGIKVELSNISKTTKITIPETQTDLIRTMLAGGTDFRGSRCILRRLFPDHTEEGSDIVLLDGYIQDWSYSPDKKGVLFTISKTLIDVGAPFPKRLMNMGCSHVFKGVRCGYLGDDGICTKTKADCTAKGRINQFGGFPWVAARQRRIMWR